MQGRFEIISLSGSFLLSENSGSRNRTGSLSVSLAGADGRVVGGGVAGMLTAATTVQVLYFYLLLWMHIYTSSCRISSTNCSTFSSRWLWVASLQMGKEQNMGCLQPQHKV